MNSGFISAKLTKSQLKVLRELGGVRFFKNLLYLIECKTEKMKIDVDNIDYSGIIEIAIRCSKYY